ncbi:MAG: Hint domain-containing protein [Pseudomonadota bacterium]
MFDYKDAFASSGTLRDRVGVTRRSGLLHGTRVATRAGWRDVEAVAIGDAVLTFDHGFQTVMGIEHVMNWPDHETCPDQAAPLEVPVGALGNAEKVWLLPRQLVLVESDLAETLTGDPFAIVTVDTLAGWKGIGPVLPRAPHAVVVLHFAQDQMIYAAEGALVHCQAMASILDCMYGDLPYLPLERPAAQAIADDLRAQERVAA